MKFNYIGTGSDYGMTVKYPITMRQVWTFYCNGWGTNGVGNKSGITAGILHIYTDECRISGFATGPDGINYYDGCGGSDFNFTVLGTI